jgi:outer membrane protein assembly factor BamB
MIRSANTEHRFQTWRQSIGASFCLLILLALGACSSTSDKPAPKALSDFKSQLNVTPAWSSQVGPIGSPLALSLASGRLAVVNNMGLLSVFNAETGVLAWQLALNSAIAAGVGGDGQRYAVITKTNELIAVSEGKEIWRAKLPALSLTAPLVAGGRVFVLTSDRTVLAFDGASGQNLWRQQRTGDPLVLKQAGILTSFQDNLMVGLSGRMVAMSPTNGVTKWELAIGSSRGTNEVERLVDLVVGVSRVNHVVCARAFQTAVTCVDAVKGTNLWTRAAQGHVGLSGNESQLFGAESDGKLLAWQRASGQVAWQTDAFKFRGLTAPSWAEGQLVLGDDLGWLHWIDTSNGQTIARVQVDNSGLAVAPLRIGKNWVTVTKNGLLQAYRAE